LNILKIVVYKIMIETNIKKLVTHNGSFHADDIFATATLSLLLEKKGESFKIIRTRDPEIIKEGDYVYDVGGIYDEKTNRFDHHHKDFKEKRENGIMYSSFGLVWKKFGGEISDSKEVADLIDKRLVSPIDANDNGIDLIDLKIEDVFPYNIESFFSSMRPSWSEDNSNLDHMFFECVKIAKKILLREIVYAKDRILAQEKVNEIYEKTKDKRIIILDGDYSHQPTYSNFKDLIYVIYPRISDNFWTVKAIREDEKKFKNKKSLPISWGGIRDEELQKITGVEDAIFCHRALFMAVAKTKEGAIKLANLALSV